MAKSYFNNIKYSKNVDAFNYIKPLDNDIKRLP